MQRIVARACWIALAIAVISWGTWIYGLFVGLSHFGAMKRPSPEISLNGYPIPVVIEWPVAKLAHRKLINNLPETSIYRDQSFRKWARSAPYLPTTNLLSIPWILLLGLAGSCLVAQFQRFTKAPTEPRD